MSPSRSAVLVTGCNGFVGQHLTRELVEHGHDVVGVATEPLAALPALLSDYVCADLAAPWPPLPEVAAAVHLAGLSAVGPSFEQPQLYLDVNGSMINHLAVWAATLAVSPRVVVVSSGAVYDATAPQPLHETSAVTPSSPYVISKLLVEQLSAYYRRRGLDLVVVRPFNHIGPGQGPGFILPDLLAQLDRVRGLGRPLRVGNLATARDYTDVRDVVRAYRLLLTGELQGESLFNVCAARSRTGHELLAMLAEAVGDTDVQVEVDPARLRPEDAPDVHGSAELLTRVTGWSPRIPAEQSVADLVADRARS